MAVTVIPRDTSGIQRQQLLQSGLSDFNRRQLAREQLDLDEEKFEESKLAGFSNRAQQAALTEQAKATAEATRIKNRIFNANPELAKNVLLDTNKSLRNQVFAQKSIIDLKTQEATNQAQLAALESAKIIKSVQAKHAEEMGVADLAIKESQVVINSFNEQLKKSETQSAAFKAQDDARKSRLVERDSALSAVSGDAGKSAIFQAFDQGKTEAEMVEIGVAADASAEESKQTGTAAEERRTKAGTQKTAGEEVLGDEDTFGTGTFNRRERAIRQFRTPVDTVRIKFDKTPDFFGTGIGVPGGKGKDKKGFDIDYAEAVELGKTKEWLDAYEKEFNEPYDIPESLQTDIEKANGTKTEAETIEPPADLVARAKKRYPKATFRKNEQGKWLVITNE
jgi:hypothetical protein